MDKSTWQSHNERYPNRTPEDEARWMEMLRIARCPRCAFPVRWGDDPDDLCLICRGAQSDGYECGEGRT